MARRRMFLTLATGAAIMAGVAVAATQAGAAAGGPAELDPAPGPVVIAPVTVP